MRTIAYLEDGTPVSITDCVRNDTRIFFDSPDNPRQQVVPKKGTIRYHHFSYLTPGGSQNNMGEWHRSWQDDFVARGCKREEDIYGSRIDIACHNHISLEFQHSHIDAREILQRTEIQKKHGFSPIWLLDGTTKAKYNNERKLLFMQGSFLRQDFTGNIIFIDTTLGIARLNPDNRVGCVIVANFLSRQNFIDNVLSGNILNHPVSDSPIPTVFIDQRNPGAGKTEALAEEAKAKRADEISKEYNSYDTLLMLFPDHPKKDEAKEKVNGKITRENTWKYPGHCELLPVETTDLRVANHAHSGNSRQTSVKGYHDKCNRYFATIHSFILCILKMLDLPNTQETTFEEKAKIICENRHRLKDIFRTCYSINFVNLSFQVQGIVKLRCDEAQIMDIHFIYALICLLEVFPWWELKCTGDILQSTGTRTRDGTNFNIFSAYKDGTLKNFNVNFLYDQPEPIYWRGKNPKLVDFLNEMVPYEKYGLKKLKHCGVTQCQDDVICEPYQQDEEAIGKIIEYVKNLCSLGDKPKDFLFISPIISENSFMAELETRLNKIYESMGYVDATFLHKSEEGKPIDLEKSKDKARLMSIHGSQGLGRKNVFCIQLSGRYINYLRTRYGDLKFDSLEQVCLSRATHRMYIFSPLLDVLTKKYMGEKNLDTSYEIERLNYKDVCSVMNDIPNNIISFEDENKGEKNVDFSYHVARYELLVTGIFADKTREQADYSENKEKHQICQVLKNFGNSHITVESDENKYYEWRKWDKITGERKLDRTRPDGRKTIALLEYRFMNIKGDVVPFHGDFKALLIELQKHFKNGRSLYDCNDPGEFMKMCFAYDYALIKWPSYRQINFCNEMRIFAEICQSESIPDFFDMVDCIRKNIDKIPSLGDGWKTNLQKTFNHGTLISLHTQQPFSYNLDDKKVCIYSIKPTLSGLNYKEVIADLSIKGWLYSAMQKDDAVPECKDEDISFAIITIDSEPIYTTYKVLKPVLIANRENILDKCERIYDKCKNGLYNRYKTINESHSKTCQMCQKTYTGDKLCSRFFDELNDDYNGQKLGEQDFHKRWADFIHKKVSGFFRFE